MRQRRHRQQTETDTAQQHDRQTQEHGRDRALDERTGQVHSGQLQPPIPVGASLLAKRPAYPTSSVTDLPLSRASSLPQVLWPCKVIPPPHRDRHWFCRSADPDGRSTDRSPAW
ncbi:hypothetical protein FHG55_12340 [Pseudomonas jessenii]|uniref:Uncharacterized protein n=1 Tax=Pseudomonas jessenii TaxID=77298 RepID=A0A5C4KZW2_PSEJE|nr:hypothetical protein FHG55_12340 [Pseudomonas jessenii]